MSRLSLISMPYSSARRGVGMGAGPVALLERHGLERALADKGFEVATAEVEEASDLEPEIARTFELNRRLAAVVREAVADERFPLVFSGNCNCAWGVTAGTRPRSVLWFDAHADFDVPDDNESGFLDVMALSTLTGDCWPALSATIPGFEPVEHERVTLVGVRDLADYQRIRLDRSGVTVARTAGEVTGSIDVSGPLYVHLDLDALDPAHGRANRYSAPDGLSPDEVVEVVETAVASTAPVAASVTAYDPHLDAEGTMAETAVNLACRLARALAR